MDRGEVKPWRITRFLLLHPCLRRTNAAWHFLRMCSRYSQVLPDPWSFSAFGKIPASSNSTPCSRSSGRLLYGTILGRLHALLFFRVRVHFSRRFSSHEHRASVLPLVSSALALWSGWLDHKRHSRHSLRHQSSTRGMGWLSDHWKVVPRQTGSLDVAIYSSACQTLILASALH